MISPAFLGAPASAATIQEDVTMSPGRTITPQEESAISSAGVKVLRHIAQARSDIRNKDSDGAKKELDQADKLLDIIEAALPTTIVKDRIWVAKKHLEYENTDDVLPDLVPIYTSLDELVDVIPTDMAKKHLDRARVHLKAGDKEKAGASLDATAAALEYTEVDLPLSATRRQVSQANTYLNQEKTDDADKALKAAEDSVVYLSVAYEQPLFSAKALLWQAVLDLDAGNDKLAKSDLKGAIGYLETASKSDEKVTGKAAEQLLSQARRLQKDLNGGMAIGERLHYLWERTHALADRSVEGLAAGWARYRADSPFKSDLIEAKLHLANARIDLFTGHEVDRAGEELSTAKGFLDKAVKAAEKQNSDKQYTNRITDVRDGVTKLDSEASGDNESRYFALQQKLDAIIQSL
jgi:hypothetical protein